MTAADRLRQWRLRARLRLARGSDAMLGVLTRGVFALLRALGPSRGPALCAAVLRRLGPLTGAHRVARNNIAASFPERNAAWHDAVALRAWDNLGRTVGEYVHMERLWEGAIERRPGARITATEAARARFAGMRDHPVPTLVFAAHLANWELPAVAAAKLGLPAAVLYRTPNSRAVAREILALRAGMMGQLIPAGMLAPTRLAKALTEGATVGMLVDQRFGRGPRIHFLGREAAANPLLALMARRFDCQVRGARAIRRPDGGLSLDITEPLELPRDDQGRIDVDAATQAVNDVIAGWVRENPGDWLWMHRRWR